MSKIVKTIFVITMLLTVPVWADGFEELHNLGYIVVSPNGPDDGGDYGPNTPGTQTSGMQEAFNEAKSTVREVYIVGGGVNGTGTDPVVYNLQTTLTIPWGQDWHNDGGDYIMNFTQTNGDCLVIDSQMNCQFKFGVIRAPNLQSGSLVRIYPHTVGPDNFIVIVSSIFKFNAIIGNGNGYGLRVDGSTNSSYISVGDIANCNKGIVLNSGSNVTVSCSSVRRCLTGLDAGGGAHWNVDVFVDPEDLGGLPVGVTLNVQEGVFRLGWEPGAYSAGQYLMLQSSCQNNLIYATNLPASGMTNSASKANSKIISMESVGFDVATPSVASSGSYRTNSTHYPVVVTILTSGSVSSWRIRDANYTETTITGALYAGQTIYLDPGDAIRFSYTIAPTWTWRAIR